MENNRKRRATNDHDATAKVLRHADDNDDALRSTQTGNSNGDTTVDRKHLQSPCLQCELATDRRSSTSCRAPSSQQRPRSAASSPDVMADSEEVDVETEDDTTTTTVDDVADLFCVDCRIQFTSPGTYRAHRSFYCSGRRSRDAVDEPDVVARRRRKVSASDAAGATVERPRRSDNQRPPTDIRPALFPPPPLASLSSPAGLMEMLSAGATPPPPPPGAFFLAPFLAAAAAAAAAGVPAAANGLPTAVQQSPTNSRPPTDRRSSTSASDDEPLDLTTCRNIGATDGKMAKRGSVSPPVPVAYPHPFPADTLDAASLFLPPSSRLPINANLPLPVVGPPPPPPPMSSPPSISHCAECNIVFYKHANYLAHKAHYCASRHATVDTSGASRDHVDRGGPSAAKSTLKSDDVGHVSATIDDARRRSPEPHELVATLDDSGTTIQFYCIPCKIKFSSLDTLRAHKQFYCPGRFDASASGGSCAGELATSSRHRQRVADDGDRATAEPVQSAAICASCGSKVTASRSGHRCPAAATATPARYQCPHCDYAAQSDSRLVEHVRAHAPSRAFRCALCGYRGNTVRGMRMHGKMHNDEAAAAAAAAGHGASSVQLPTFTDDCVIEYEEPPAIPPRRQSVTSTAAGAAVTGRSTSVDTDLLRQKNEPYKRRRSRKAYEKAEYSAPAPPEPASTTVICAECSVPLLDTTRAQAHASAHAAERLLAWEALYGATKTQVSAASQVTKANRMESPVMLETKSTVKVEQCDDAEGQDTSTVEENVDNDDRKCNGTDAVAMMTQTHPVPSGRDMDTLLPPTSVESPPPACHNADPIAHRDADVPVAVSPGRGSGSPPMADVVATTARPLRAPAAIARPSTAAAATSNTPPRRSLSLDVASRYCEQCDITFMYASTFVAHKKYYCSSHTAERADPTARASAATGVAV